MQIKDPDIFAAIEAIGAYYRSNIVNRFTRRAISMMTLDPQSWNLIEDFTEKLENYRYQGYHLDELYSQILAMARFVYQARRDIAPKLSYLASSGGSSIRESSADRTLRDMAVANFGPNLKVLADKVNELYMKVINLDKEGAGKGQPVYATISELKEIGRYLVG